LKTHLLIMLLLVLSFAVDARISAPNITGTWDCTIDRPPANGGPVKVTFIFKQEGEKLTGTYTGIGSRGPLSEEKITGTAKDDKAVFAYELKHPGMPDKPGLTVTFNGIVESANKMTGTVGSPYCQAGCKWTAAKKK
jgi:hypothetical protein